MKKQPIDRPLSFLPIFAEALNGDLSTAQEQYEVLLPAKDRPSALDDALINRIIKLHEEKNEFIENYDRQLKLWRQEKLSPSQLEQLQELEAKLPLLKATNDKVLKLAYDIQPHTIDKILAMDPLDLALGHL